MVALARPDMGPYRCEYGVVALERVANRERRLPDAYLAEGEPGVSSAFLEYAAPLLGPPPAARFRLR
jgi:6-phosphofructokinase 1